MLTNLPALTNITRQIETADQLNSARKYLGPVHSGKHFELENDIDLVEIKNPGDGDYINEEDCFESIGKYENAPVNKFLAIHDSNGYINIC